MLLSAAKRLRSGRATGLDLWQKEDQAGNSREATMRNAAAENVADRVELIDGDARKMPFVDNEFDVILSSWALHNIYERTGRDAALREIARVSQARRPSDHRRYPPRAGICGSPPRGRALRNPSLRSEFSLRHSNPHPESAKTAKPPILTISLLLDWYHLCFKLPRIVTPAQHLKIVK